MSEISLHQRIVNAAASQEVENVKARHTYLHGRADATGEWDEIWCMDENASWAHAFGRMRGGDQVWWGSVGDYDKMCFENWLEIRERYPEVTGKDPRPLMEASVHTLVTDVIEVAADGKSARGSFITPEGGVLPRFRNVLSYYRCRKMHIAADEPFCLDGEICPPALDLTVEVIPEAVWFAAL